MTEFNVHCYTQRILPNAEQKLRTMGSWRCRRCWCMVGLISQSSMLRVIIVYPLFIAGLYTMQKKKKLSFSPFEATAHSWQYAVWRLSASTYRTPDVNTFGSFLMRSKVSKLSCNQLLMILQVQLAPDTSLHEVIPPILHLQTFSVCQSVLYLIFIDLILYFNNQCSI